MLFNLLKGTHFLKGFPVLINLYHLALFLKPDSKICERKDLLSWKACSKNTINICKLHINDITNKMNFKINYAK